MLKEGLFCVFEGIDGSGKTTLIQKVREELLNQMPELSDSILLLREPTSGKTGQKIRAFLQAGNNLQRSEWIDLFMLDREENVNSSIKPELKNKKLILQDRYFYSTAAYQGDETEPPGAQEILEESLKRGFPEPSLLFFLDIPPEVALERITKSREQMESFETLAQQEKFYKNFLRILPEECIFLDAMENSDEIAFEISKIILGAIEDQ
ncbi:MAG: dTMP kinase [Spirochaetia bacterium]|nr:dTMP kinase [Spirochaetia bacterium]